jgi:hypothetical protein
MRIDLCHGVSKCALSLAAIITLALTASSQGRDDHAFAGVPAQYRGSLLQSMLEFVEFDKTKQYGKLYEMLEKPSGANKEDYVAARVRAETKFGILREFAPQSVIDVTLNDTGPVAYEITGKGWVMKANDIVEKRMSLTATFHGGVWKFSELSESFLHIEKARYPIAQP